MIIPVIGHICLDVIHHHDGTTSESYGGIYFAVATLANLLDPKNDTVRPVFGIGKSDYDALIEQLKQYPNVDVSGIYKINGLSNQVELTYSSSDARVERSLNIADPIPWKKIRPELDAADIVLVNMISGFDILLDTLDELRMETRDSQTPVYLDIHSLTLGINEDRTRFHRPVETWRRWAFMLHAVQMNEEEAAVVSPEKLDESSLARHVLALNTKSLFITRGKRGCSLFVDNHKHIEEVDYIGLQPKGPVDPTGCGDVFGAAYCAHYAKTHDILKSAAFANTIAGTKVQFPGSSQIDKLSMYRLNGKITAHAKSQEHTNV